MRIGGSSLKEDVRRINLLKVDHLKKLRGLVLPFWWEHIEISALIPKVILSYTCFNTNNGTKVCKKFPTKWEEKGEKMAKICPWLIRWQGKFPLILTCNEFFDLFFLMDSGFQCDNQGSKTRLATRGSA